MIQVLYLTKFLATLMAFFLAWLAFLWYQRTRSDLVRDFSRFALVYMLRVINQVLIFFLYNGGFGFFVFLAPIFNLMDSVSFILIFYFWIKILQYIGREQRWPMPGFVLYLGAGLISLVFVLSQLQIQGFFPAYPGDIKVLLNKALFAVTILAVGLSAAFLTSNRDFASGADNPIHRPAWISMLLMSILLGIALLVDEYVPFELTITYRGLYLPPRWFSLFATVIAMIPLSVSLLLLITRYRAGLAFIDVEGAIRVVEASVKITDEQEEIFRYFFEKGWGELIRRFGMKHVKEKTGPVLSAMGLFSLSQLMHLIQQRESEIHPLA